MAAPAPGSREAPSERTFEDDLAAVPTEWLEAFAQYLGDHDALDPDEAFRLEIEASFRMREIHRRDGRSYRGMVTVDQALAELARRRKEADPGWLLAFAVYRFPDGDTGDERKLCQFDALLEMRAIARRYSRSPATNVPSPGVITASPSSRRTRSALRAVPAATS